MPLYRIAAEVVVEAPDAQQATDRLRDALTEIDAELDTVTWVEVSEEPRVMGLSRTRTYALWNAVRELSPEVADEGFDE